MNITKKNNEVLHVDTWFQINRESIISNKFCGAIAYFTDDSMLNLHRGDLLVVNASDEILSKGVTNPHMLKKHLSAGVKIYSQSRLHAKVYIFDKCAIIGSMNASFYSREKLLECALISREESVVQDSLNFVRFAAHDAELVDEKFLDRACEIFRPIVKNEMNNSFDANQTKLWHLQETPNAINDSKNLRAYFIAMILIQTKTIEAEKHFALWPNLKNISSHIQKGRIEKIKTEKNRFFLTKDGVNYFVSDEQCPETWRLNKFMLAIKTGDSDILPEDLRNKVLKPFFV